MRATAATRHESARRAILDAARALVLSRGHEKLSLRAVARRAGYSPASLYEYFDGKDQILRTLAAEASARLGAELRSAVQAPDRTTSALVRLGLAYVRFAREHGEDFLLLFARLPSQRRRLSEEATVQSPYRLVLEAVTASMERGEVRSGDRLAVEQLAYGLWATAHGMAMLQLTHLTGFDADFKAADRVNLVALAEGWRSGGRET
ncbi:MAG TPA: TetR/AcrR family transcriptional regulator [Myxococcaceae bacterium]|nr:TetR/AcrR family transcriptional regulator [Myxococcaceae bacterium]